MREKVEVPTAEQACLVMGILIEALASEREKFRLRHENFHEQKDGEDGRYDSSGP